jgi:hypothetical protein
MVRKAETFPPVTMGHIRGHGCRPPDERSREPRLRYSSAALRGCRFQRYLRGALATVTCYGTLAEVTSLRMWGHSQARLFWKHQSLRPRAILDDAKGAVPNGV